MKVGADKPWKVGVAIALAVLSLVMVLRAFLSPASQQAASVTPSSLTRAAAAPARRGGQRGRPTQPNVAAATDPRLNLGLLKTSEDVSYTGAGRNIFRAEAEQEIAKVIKPPVHQPPPPPPPPVQQIAPITLRFFGFANRAGEPTRVFLADGDNVFVASEGEVVERRYKVLRIGVNSVDVQDLLNNVSTTIPLSQG